MSKEEEGTEIGGISSFCHRYFGAGQSERFLKITALIPFPILGWFLSRDEQVGTWNSKMENARLGVMVACSYYPPHLHTSLCFRSHAQSSTKVFFEHFLF